jgi:2-amino-4-hydroxy-6-hydroxymethyldihydropteridine diphosphokinase
MVSQPDSHLQKNDVYLAFGSNLGDRRGTIVLALQQLSRVITFTQISSLYETEPVGYKDQPRFLNGVCHGLTTLNPQQLLKHTQGTEIALGRQPTFRNGPRPIDIDILLYDQQTVNEPNLIIPHPRMIERAFVLVPLTEIAPKLFIPQYQQTVVELLAKISTTGVQAADAAPISLDLLHDHRS